MTGPGLRIIHFDETASTNADAMRLALAGEPLPLWITAERQTAGRGRAGRGWTSGAGNLQASLAVVCAAPLGAAGQLSLVAGISAYDAVRSTSALAPIVRLRLKWPNDLLIGSAKTGGILVESTTARGEPGFLAVIGFGINIATYPDDLGREATAIGDHTDRPPTPRALLEALAAATSHWLAVWDDARNFAAIRLAWHERAGPIGEPIVVNTSSGQMRGTYQGLAASGALCVVIDGQAKEITYGDVALSAEAGTRGT